MWTHRGKGNVTVADKGYIRYILNKIYPNSKSCPHITPKPGKQGRVFWLSGPPGAGKSTTCQLMAREKGYVYYEADATMQFINPFVDVHADNPTLATFEGKALKVSYAGLLHDKTGSGLVQLTSIQL